MLIQALQKVYRKPAYIFLTLFVSAVMFALAVLFPNLRLITDVLASTDVSLASKIQLPISLLGAIGTNFSAFAAGYTILIALLFGIYIGMVVYFLKRRIKDVGKSGVTTGFLGIMSGVLGVGCAACGTFLLTSLGLVGASGVLSVLPLKGGEFGILSIVLVSVAIYMTAKKIQSPLTCKIEN